MNLLKVAKLKVTQKSGERVVVVYTTIVVSRCLLPGLRHL